MFDFIFSRERKILNLRCDVVNQINTLRSYHICTYIDFPNCLFIKEAFYLMAVLEFAMFLFLSSSTFFFRYKRLHTSRKFGESAKPDDDSRRIQKRDIFDNESFLKFLSSQNERSFSYKNHIIKANTSAISSKHPVIEAILQR